MPGWGRLDGIDIFPPNGLDRSIMTPVVIGVALMTLATETLGWPFAGLVVPGYLASVFAIAPVTGTAIVLESLVAYALARAVGVWLPFVDAWSQFFGRERFFLVIAASLVVRIFFEGYALPLLAEHYEFAHASELYSIGLVLIPLVANAAWNIGLTRGTVQVVITSVATYAILQYAVIPYTNLSLSKVELTFERIALDFLASPKAYLVLLVGTIAGARANVLYGWDFNGILVPGLLAVAWYTPSKLIATLIEATLVVWLSQKLVLTPLFTGKLIEGPRRLLLVFSVGFAVKWLFGGVLAAVWPGATATDFYGFGYVLPTLLSMKMWQYRSIPHVLMPTLTVSLVGFLGGNAIGLAMHLLLPAPSEEQIAPPPSERGAIELELALQAEPPERRVPELLSGDRLFEIGEIAERVRRRDVDAATRRAARSHVDLLRYSVEELGDVILVRDDRGANYVPAIALRPNGYGGLVVRGVDSLEMAAASLHVARALDVSWWVILPDRVAAAEDWLEKWRPLVPRGPVRTLHVGSELAVSRTAYADAEHLKQRGFARSGKAMVLKAEDKERWLASVLPHPELGRRVTWGELETQLPKLPVTGSDVARVSRARTRFMSLKLAPALEAWAEGAELDPKTRALIDMMGFSLHPVDGAAGEALMLVSRAATVPGSQLVWVVQRTSSKLAVIVPFAIEQVATPKVGKPLARSLGARHLLFSETRPPRNREAVVRNIIRRTYLERVVESLLAHGSEIISVHVVMRGEGLGFTDLVVSSTRDVSELPVWAVPALEKLADAEVEVRTYTSDRATAFARGSGHPIMEYARSLYPNRVVALWLTERLRQRFVESELKRLPEWLEKDGMRRVQAELSETVSSLPATGASCDLEAVRNALARVHRTWNPYHARDAHDASSACGAFVVDDVVSGTAYLVGVSGQRRWAFSLVNEPTLKPHEVASADRFRTAADFNFRWIELLEPKPP